jgi:hypothetical protein
VPNGPPPDNPLRARPPGPLPAFDDLAFTMVLPVVRGGRAGFLVGRATQDGRDGLVAGPDGRVPLLATEDDAWTFAERAIPPHPDPEIAELERQLAPLLRDGTLADDLAGARGGVARQEPAPFDLDAARAWAARPSRDAAGPRVLADVWALLAMAGELPPAPGPDPMWLAAVKSEERRAQSDPMEVLRATAMLLEWMVIDEDRRARREGRASAAAWPAEGGLWTTDDDARLAGALGPALAAFEARLTEDAESVARALAGG